MHYNEALKHILKVNLIFKFSDQKSLLFLTLIIVFSCLQCTKRGLTKVPWNYLLLIGIVRCENHIDLGESGARIGAGKYFI